MITRSEYGAVNGALALRYPQDRSTDLAFQADINFSTFSYAKFYDDIINAGSDFDRRQRILARWQPDLQMHAVDLLTFANVSTYRPYSRNSNESHCLTIIDFSGTAIEELGIPSITPVIDDTLGRGRSLLDWPGQVEAAPVRGPLHEARVHCHGRRSQRAIIAPMLRKAGPSAAGSRCGS